MVQALLAGGVPVPSDISTSSALIQAMTAQHRAEEQDRDSYRMPGKNQVSSGFAQVMQARQMADHDQERDEYYSTAISSANPLNRSSAVAQAMQARQRAEGDATQDVVDLPSSVSSVMMQVMQARQQAEDEDRTQWAPAPPQNRAPSGSSALIQAMLARQQAQNEYDDGY